jgi:tetratricopeptide (TPR) repeat protein
MPKKISVFVSSKMSELRAERAALSDLLPSLGGELFEISPWVFEEDASASNRSIRDVYLHALDSADLYLGIFWNDYGEWTIDEFNRAGEMGIPRHVYVKNVQTDKRDPRLTRFLEKQTDVRFGLTPRWFTDVEDFKTQVARSVRQWLEERELAYHSATSALVAAIADEIPDLPRRLIGRTKLIERVGDLLKQDDRVLLRGFGGAGKTAIAATIAADFIDRGQGNVIWIRAGAAEADTIFEALARAFDQQQEIMSVEGDERLQLIRRMLAQQKALLVLDDAWNGAALSRLIQVLPRRMPMLVTSRQRFPLDEIIEIGQLEKDEALHLLGYHARQEYSHHDSDALQLCQLLGNHAFALEIAGKSLKVYNLTPDELVQRVQDAPHDLAMPAGFGDLGRKSIKSLLDTSIDALQRPLYEVFAALGSMFEPSATADLLARVLGAAKENVEQRLLDLVERGLVNERQLAGVRYFHLHDLAYSYARTLYGNLRDQPQRIVDACREFAMDHAADLAGLDVEFGNLLEAAETAEQLGDDESLIAIMNVFAVAGPYFAARGHTVRTLELLRDAIRIARECGQKRTAHFLLGKLGNAYASSLGSLDAALIAYLDALQLAQEIEDKQREAILLTVIGTVRFRQNEADADEYHQRAERIARETEDQIVLCQVLHNRGAQAIDEHNPQPDYVLGRTLSAEAAEIAKQLNLHHLYFYSLLNRGAGEHELRELVQAVRTHQEALEFARSEQNYPWMADAYFSLGEDHHELQQRPDAQQSFEEAMRLYRDTNNQAKAERLADYLRKNGYSSR